MMEELKKEIEKLKSENKSLKTANKKLEKDLMASTKSKKLTPAETKVVQVSDIPKNMGINAGKKEIK